MPEELKPESQRYTIEQERARCAWNLVTTAREKEGFEFDKYKSYVTSASVLIQTNGLLQSLAFWMSKKNSSPAHEMLLNHLAKMVLDEENLIIFYNTVQTADVPVYRQLTNKALASLIWMKRFVSFVEPNINPREGQDAH